MKCRDISTAATITRRHEAQPVQRKVHTLHKTNGLRVTSDSVVLIKLTRTVCVASENVRVYATYDEAKQARKYGGVTCTHIVKHANV